MSRHHSFAGLVVAAAMLALAPPATATVKTYTLQYGPMRVGGFNTVLPKARVRTPKVNGYIVGMHAILVDSRGRPVTVRDVMMHHVFFQRYWKPKVRYECQGGKVEAFYGTGEEDQSLQLPKGYGYQIRANDRWRVGAMLMSHTSRTKNVYLQYRVTVDTTSRLTPVRAFWLRANGCPNPGYTINGGQPSGSVDARTTEWHVPYDLRIVAAGGHLHAGAKDMWLSQPRCGDRRLLDNKPLFGMPDNIYYRARPILHEPGPVDTRFFQSKTGVLAKKGEVIRVNATYAADRPRAAMAVMHLYVAREPRAPSGCVPLPADRLELTKPIATRPEAPPVIVPLTGIDARGHTYTITQPPPPAKAVADGAVVQVGDGGFDPPHVSLAGPARLTWQSTGNVFHNVRLIDGPRMVASPTLTPGRIWTSNFTTPGRYTLFCTWHPVTMHAVVDIGVTTPP